MAYRALARELAAPVRTAAANAAAAAAALAVPARPADAVV
jgi:hypothetical protein